MPAPVEPTLNADDVESWRRFYSVTWPNIVRADGTVDFAALQKFKVGLIARLMQVDFITSNISPTFNHPTVVVGAGAGTGGTATLLQGNNGTNYWASGNAIGTLKIVTGTGTTANATLATITFGADINGAATTGGLIPANDARIDLTEADKVTIQAGGPTQKVIALPNGTGDGWIVKSNDTPLAASTTYTWNYLITV